MNRGSSSSGRAAATAGLKRSVWPTARGTPASGRRGDHGVGLGQLPRHRLLDQHVHAGRQKRQRDLPMQLGRHGERHRVDVSEDVPKVAKRTGPVRAGDLGRPRLVDVHDRHQLHARQRGQNARVMAAEMPDPTTAMRSGIIEAFNHENMKSTTISTQEVLNVTTKTAMSTTFSVTLRVLRDFVFSWLVIMYLARRAADDGDAGLVGGSNDGLAVNHERLAGVDRQQRGAGCLHRLNRRHADDRHVEPHVLFRLGHLDDADARAGQLTGARNHRVGAFHRLDGNEAADLTAIVCPISRPRWRRPRA